MMNNQDDTAALREAGSFVTTHWGTVLAAGTARSPEATRALSQLCRVYWHPLYVYLRRRGFSEEDAKDHTQGFFEHLLARHDLAKADPERGRFRSFLLKSLQHYVANEQRDARRLKRGAGQPVASLDETAETRYQAEPGHDLTPEKLYERRWAMTVINTALQKLREEYSAAGQTALSQELEGILTGSEDSHLGEIGRRLGLSEGAVKVAAHRFRKRFGKALRECIQETVSTPGEVDDELRHLQAILQEGLTTIGKS